MNDVIECECPKCGGYLKINLNRKALSADVIAEITFEAFYAGMDAYNDWLKEDETWEEVGGTPGYVGRETAQRMYEAWKNEKSVSTSGSTTTPTTTGTTEIQTTTTSA